MGRGRTQFSDGGAGALKNVVYVHLDIIQHSFVFILENEYTTTNTQHLEFTVVKFDNYQAKRFSKNILLISSYSEAVLAESRALPGYMLRSCSLPSPLVKQHQVETSLFH